MPRTVGFVLMLSRAAPPSPRDEIEALAAHAAAASDGRTYLLLNRDVDPRHYKPGVSRVAILEAGSHDLLALATFDGVLRFETDTRHIQPPALYLRTPPPYPKLWIRLRDFQRLDPPGDPADLGWTIITSDQPLQRDTLPRGRAAGYFRVRQG